MVAQSIGGQHRFLAWGITLLCSSLVPAAWALHNSFDVREASIATLHHALFTGITTCRDIVSSFLARIEEFNQVINSIVSLNPDALSDADHLDQTITQGNVTGALFCVPILVKDNFDVVGMSNSGGSAALAYNMPVVDAPVVRALRDAKAIILGKTNLHEMALEGLTVSSLSGQSRNPYDLSRTPGGSSGGSGAAIAANLAILATGTDTMNSLRNPASANALFSLRPTRGLLSRAGVIPVSFTQDTVGAMARNPQDLAVALTVMASVVGYDPQDNLTSLAPPEVRYKDYSALVDGGSLKGQRFGLLDGLFNHTPSDETTPVNEVMANMVLKLIAAGAEVVNITDTNYNIPTIAKLDVQVFEFREMLDAYLAGAAANDHSQPRSFSELYSSGKFLVIPAQHGFIRRALQSSTNDAAYHQTLHLIQKLTRSLQATFASNKLDALIYPQQKNLVVKVGSPSQSGRNGILAVLTGHPVVCVPAGFSPPSAAAPVGVPIGMEVLGRPWAEDFLLNIASHINELVPIRRMPPFCNQTVEPRVYKSVPSIVPNQDDIPTVYPRGCLDGPLCETI